MERADPVSPTVHSSAQETLGDTAAGTNEDLQLKAERALACPCVAGLREGPCGKEFSEAFVCFIKSTAEPKGSDCVESFLNMQSCMLDYPDAFSRHKSGDIPEEEQTEDIDSPEKLASGARRYAFAFNETNEQSK
ncbi:hypothetical protein GOP47_0012364 [Adiantum capillus-veneris]|uniref:Mitochondrial intermembrane space import and assembly protein 40 n=1 Tax=Adiantum capillus-veneris TaxID=13818 RepID=A0A9D4URX2_ADICA|nr:hypothetical protein GOP47_0012364 [Adiantum capillus-veneris]